MNIQEWLLDLNTTTTLLQQILTAPKYVLRVFFLITPLHLHGTELLLILLKARRIMVSGMARVIVISITIMCVSMK